MDWALLLLLTEGTCMSADQPVEGAVVGGPSPSLLFWSRILIIYYCCCSTTSLISSLLPAAWVSSSWSQFLQPFSSPSANQYQPDIEAVVVEDQTWRMQLSISTSVDEQASWLLKHLDRFIARRLAFLWYFRSEARRIDRPSIVLSIYSWHYIVLAFEP